MDSYLWFKVLYYVHSSAYMEKYDLEIAFFSAFEFFDDF